MTSGHQPPHTCRLDGSAWVFVALALLTLVPAGRVLRFMNDALARESAASQQRERAWQKAYSFPGRCRAGDDAGNRRIVGVSQEIPRKRLVNLELAGRNATI